ncbi:MAG: zinc-ribbon domain-containing protein [Clostridia bacterium]|nr:zinc-ribbon domain-containing protein [Clostridia bacterium]
MFCPNCGTQNPDNANVCMNCGNALRQQAPVQPAYQQPAYQQPMYQQPMYQQPAYQQPMYEAPVSGGSKGMKITGMILGIIGFVMSIISNIYCLATYDPWYWYADEVASTNIAFLVITFPLALVGLILCSKSRIATGGKVLSLLGVIFSGVHFILMLGSLS